MYGAKVRPILRSAKQIQPTPRFLQPTASQLSTFNRQRSTVNALILPIGTRLFAYRRKLVGAGFSSRQNGAGTARAAG